MLGKMHDKAESKIEENKIGDSTKFLKLKVKSKEIKVDTSTNKNFTNVLKNTKQMFFEVKMLQKCKHFFGENIKVVSQKRV
jgi:hypothetical protein